MFKKVLKNYKFPLILLCSIIIGSIIGIILKEDAIVLKPFGTVFINLLYTIVVPLVFFTISSSISSIKSFKKLGKIFIIMLDIGMKIVFNGFDILNELFWGGYDMIREVIVVCLELVDALLCVGDEKFSLVFEEWVSELIVDFDGGIIEKLECAVDVL